MSERARLPGHDDGDMSFIANLERAAVLGDDAARVHRLRAAHAGCLEIGAPKQGERISRDLPGSRGLGLTPSK